MELASCKSGSKFNPNGVRIIADFVDCFTSHRNVRVTCVKPVDQRTLSSVTQCEELCLTQPTMCKTAQYDMDKSICEIFSAPPLLGSDTQKTRRRLSRNADASSKPVGKCAPALQPSIGTIYLVPRQECFEETKQTSYVGDGNVVSIEEKILGAGLDRSQIPQQPPPQPPRDPFSAIPVEVLPIVPDCPLGEKARVQIIDGVEVKDLWKSYDGIYVRSTNLQVTSSSSVTFKADSPEKCVHACMTSSYPDASRLPLLCRSAQYNRQSSKCSVFPDALNPNGYLEYKPNSNVLYMEKLCIADAVLPLSCDEIFRRIPQHVLFGHASEIITVASEEECIRECVLAKTKRSVECRSLLHYSDVPISNCILNVHTRLTRPEYFVPELDDKVDYVQMPECAKNVGGGNFDSAISGNEDPLMSIDTRIVENDKSWGLPPGVGTVESEWSEWTSCDRKTSTRRRERLCIDCVERIQMQPCFSNENFNNVLNTFINEQEKVGPPGIPLPKATTKLPSTKIIPFPLSSLSAQNNKTDDLEFFGPPFENLSPSWKSTFRRRF
ncbi:hypothetical protein Y032_0151g2799 [Ancylostoma ceylanicum]|uniref:Apple domain-containing protein n=1 Tax=Ancylostoma ceylanicum TaxID=53326 RepID=A0A016T0X6_9BILA|nr:hypothetical protein Y032_0151g2799 [Ancylostoma ceylanicum]